TPVARAVVRGTADDVAATEAARADLMAAGVIAELDVAEGEPSVAVELAASE
ncbi:MAG: hypothetical protein QOJ00_1837, partial [Actinomycetota bacterium]